ncbi:MAG TPA: MDR family MFS transporter [Acidimicrobiales bacterium]|nr:MDR family MFS transporter [Acidimicrobiales bacterium]
MVRRDMSQKAAVTVVYAAAMFMAIMDSTIVIVALPTLGREFHVQPEAAGTITIAYLVSLGVFIPVSGWVGDKLGGRRTLLMAITLFTVASALCGTAHGLGELVVYRVLQGAGGGLMTPVGLAMFFRVFPPVERVKASGILMVPTMLAPALGPVLGGLFVTGLSWRWVFYVNVPIGIAALVFGAVFLHDHREHEAGRFDLVGFAASGTGLGLLMYGLSEGPIKGWASLEVVATCIAGTFVLVLMVVVELRQGEPLVDLRLLSNRLFGASNLVIALYAMAFIGVLYLVSLFYQEGLGLSAMQAGLSTLPEPVGAMVAAQLVTRKLYPTIGPRRLITVGLLVVAATMVAMSSVGLHTSLWQARVIMFVMGLGLAGVFIPVQAACMATISPASTARASMMFNANRQLGAAIGVAVLSTVLVALHPVHVVSTKVSPNLHAYDVSFITGAAVAVIAAVCASLLVRDADALSTMTGRRGRTSLGVGDPDPTERALVPTAPR